jgi:hypothetical protein
VVDEINTFSIRLPSETIFSSELKVNMFFGLPMSVSSGGLAMDADRVMTMVKALDGNKDKPVQFMLASGPNSSALEHAVPGQLFSTPNNPAQGISAVKALKLANDQGIPLYTINRSNIATVLPQLQLDSGTISDIQNAVSAGKSVTVSKTDIAYNSWTGCGYIIIDPNTGAGAYMISGGMSGAWAIVNQLATLFLYAGLVVFLSLVLSAIFSPLFAVGGAVLGGLIVGFGLSQLLTENDKYVSKMIAGDLFQALLPILAFMGSPLFWVVLFALVLVQTDLLDWVRNQVAVNERKREIPFNSVNV